MECKGLHSTHEIKRSSNKKVNRRIRRSNLGIIQNLVEKVKNKGTFNYALKAIAMLTQASLTLKKMPPSVLK
jgi:hypothetical protein